MMTGSRHLMSLYGVVRRSWPGYPTTTDSFPLPSQRRHLLIPPCYTEGETASRSDGSSLARSSLRS